MRNSSYVPHYAISRYSIMEFNTGAEPFMVVMIIMNIIIYIWSNLVLPIPFVEEKKLLREYSLLSLRQCIWGNWHVKYIYRGK